MKRASPLFKRIAVIGLGLLGSSLAHAIRHNGLGETVVGHDADTRVMSEARSLGLCGIYAKTAAEAVSDADLVILATPVGAFNPIAEEIGPALANGAVVTDVGSVKRLAIEAVTPHMPAHAVYVPSHPVAGTEQSGPSAGFADLFENRWCILTPIEGSDPQAVARVHAFWEGCGSSIEVMDAEHHDLVLAITSHIPHLIAYNIVGTAADLEEVTRSEVIKFSAGGFRDFTRIAASDPTMWRDIFLANKDAVLEMLARFNEDLAALQRAIRWGDGDALHRLFTRTRSIRQSIIDLGQETAEPDFGRPHGAAEAEHGPESRKKARI